MASAAARIASLAISAQAVVRIADAAGRIFITRSRRGRTIFLASHRIAISAQFKFTRIAGAAGAIIISAIVNPRVRHIIRAALASISFIGINTASAVLGAFGWRIDRTAITANAARDTGVAELAVVAGAITGRIMFVLGGADRGATGT